MRRSLRSSAGVGMLDAPEPVHAGAARRALAATAPSASASIAGMAWMYLGGATFAIGVIALTQSDKLGDALMVALIALAYAVGLGLLLGRRRLPVFTIDLALGFGVLVTTLAINHLGDVAEQYLSMLYVWSALNAAFLLSQGRARVQLALIA